MKFLNYYMVLLTGSGKLYTGKSAWTLTRCQLHINDQAAFKVGFFLRFNHLIDFSYVK